jgi:hypothetical protein
MLYRNSSKSAPSRRLGISWWLLAAVVLAHLGAASPSASACPGSCAPKIASGWTPVVVEIRDRGAQLEAISFSERVKRHLGYRFAKRKAQFVRAQQRIEHHRSVHKRRAKARQFAAARRRVAQHVHKLLPEAGSHLRRFAHRKPHPLETAASHAVNWRALSHRAAHNSAPDQPQAD